MTHDIRISFEGNYLHVQISGSGNQELALKLWQDIAQACEQYQCYNILGEQQLNTPVSTLDALDHVDIFKKAGITANHRIAWVDHNPRTFETTEFIRNLLVNRAIGKGRLFSRVEEAKKWLLGTS